ncbi:insulinase family protein [Hyphobacterium sp. CCMP332]|nr:insulinase family protein [Hyphobacterium sp. CCMP332]
MKKILTLVTLAIFTMGSKSNADTKMVEKVAQSTDKLVIPYEKYILDNGLTLIIHEDHSDPVVHIDVTYHVGSAREEIGKSGFAHFFEHMMFQGSENVGDDEHFKIVNESGGTLNGSTNKDRTNYFETLPSNQLEIGLWLEADRMGYLLDAVTQEKFEIQRATVKNERGQNYDNRPYGLAGEYSSKNLYPYGHPYSWLTIGYIEDLNRVDVNDLKKFFMRWYGPNNATLTVGGDVNPKNVLALTEKYFGSIPMGPEVKNMDKMIPTIESDRYVSYEDQIRFPMLRMTWPTVPVYHEDEAAIDCFASIIGGGQTSILHKNLIKTQKAVQASAFQPCYELSGEFTMLALANPGTQLAEIEKVFRESLKEFEERGVKDEDVRKYAAQRESSVIFGLSTVRGKVSQLAQYATFTESPNYIQKDLERYQNLTTEDVMNAYNKYIKSKASVILSVYPEGAKDLIAADDNFEIDKSNYKAGPDEYSDLVYNKPKDDFDRGVRPPSGENPVITIPETWRHALQNDIPIIGTSSNEIPVVNILLTLEGGQRLEAKDPSKAGITNLMTSLMNESTQNRSAEDMAKALELLGSSVSVRASDNQITVNIRTLKKYLGQTMELANEILFQPGFKEEDFNRLKKQQLEYIANQNTQAPAIATKVYNKILYGQNNILGIPSIGTTETVENISLADVKQYYARVFSPSTANIVVVGQVEKEEIIPLMNSFQQWNGKAVEIPKEFKIPIQENTTVYLVDKEKSAQSQVRIGKYTGLTYDATGEYYKTTLSNYPLGGFFNSRINMNLREDKGYTYGARSSFSADKYDGTFTAYAGVKLDATAASVNEFMSEISNYYQNGMTDSELEFMKNSIGQREALSYESPYQKASFLRRIITYNLEDDFTQKQNEILQNIKKEELDMLAKKYLDPDKMNIIVVGDKSVIKTDLEKLGFPVKELDKDGNEIVSPDTDKLKDKK